MNKDDNSIFEDKESLEAAQKEVENSESQKNDESGTSAPIDISDLEQDSAATEGNVQDTPKSPEGEKRVLSTASSDNDQNNSDGPADENNPQNVQSEGETNPLTTKNDDNKQQDFLSFNEAMKQKGGSKGKKPEKLNKTFITILLGSVFFLVMLLLVWRPDIKLKEKKSENKKPQASSNLYYDLEGAAHKTQKTADKPKEEYPKNNNAEKPKDNGVNPKYTNKEELSKMDPYTAGQQVGKASAQAQQANYTIDIPDTRNDSLHGKTITGIKGITSTQNTYLTDYELQKLANTAPASKSDTVTGRPASSGLSSPTDAVERLLSSTQGANSYNAQNNQSDKNNFMNRFTGEGGNGQWLGVNTIWQGTIFEATLTSEINTDLPGEVTARISKNIYSSQDSRYLLIPQNSILLGTYNSSISYNQRRTQVIWTTLIRPDGYQINLGGMNATDAKGASGLPGFINDHPMAYLKAVMLMSVVNIINAEFQNATDSTSNQYVQNVAANAQQVSNELAGKLLDRAMDIQPTIKIKSGTKINIVVNQNLTVPVVDKFPVTEKYERGRLPKEIQ